MTAAGNDLLIELGTEELPPTALRTLMETFAAGIINGLDQAGIAHGDHRALASPRRLAVLANAVAERQPDRRLERKGPTIAAAFGDDGQPTRAAEGFARSCGVTVDALTRQNTNQGERLAYNGVEPGQSTASLLHAIINDSLARLPIPKRMRWGTSQASFVRPAHWLLVKHGKAVIPVEVLGLHSGDITHGHRFHHPEPIRINVPANYPERLRKPGYVIVDFDERRDWVREQVAREGARAGGHAVIGEALLDEVTALVEWPVALLGSFDEAFLRIPEEALVSSMEGHQKYFAVRGDDGSLLPRFITVANLESRDPAQVVAGNERVIRPRLADAAFFWDQDRRIPLAARVDALAEVIFQQRLGTLYDKSARVAALAGQFATSFGVDAKSARRAAWLAKADLLTEMVGEFPELQGIMGRYYALEDGETPAVANAIDQAYRPRHGGDAVAPNPLGQLLAVAERADTLTGIFAIGKAPTGAKDPFGLRRAALGLVRTLIEGSHPVDLRELLKAAAVNLPAEVNDGRQVDAVVAFCMDRLRAFYQDQNIPVEIFAAVREVAPVRLDDFDRRVQACRAFMRRPEGASLAAANKRSRNILRKAGAEAHRDDGPCPARFAQAEEHTLHTAVTELETEVSTLASGGNYTAALERLAALRTPVDRFFDGVLVMADDPALRANRLALLHELSQLFLRIADVSQLPSGE